MRESRKIFYRFIVGALLLNVLWWLASIVIDGNAMISPIKVYKALPEVLVEGNMLHHLGASMRRLFIGIPIALILGVLIALLMFYFRLFGKMMSAFTYLAYPIPKLALLPIVMLIAGLGDGGKITMIVLIVIFQVIVNVRDSLSNIPKECFLISTSLNASQIKVFRHIILPATLPEILSTTRVAIGTAISVLFVTETYGTDKGMGYFIIDSWMRFNYIDMYSGIIVLSMAGFFLFILIDILEHVLCGWKEVTNYQQN
ncbi:ABC transporter permease [Porphyromonadaceae bacterium W3.11]|nr:ABC transporter permease [Porphyromonadaceae bacterium W3.11]